MIHFIRTLAVISVAVTLTVVGCNEEAASPDPGTAGAHSPDDGLDHDDELAADDRDQARAGGENNQGGDEHGDEHALGSVTIDGVTLEVAISGAIAPNAKVQVDIVQTAGPTPAAARLWIGIESGSGSLKSRAGGHDNHFHGQAEVPAPIPAGAALWIEVELASGSRASRSLPLP